MGRAEARPSDTADFTDQKSSCYFLSAPIRAIRGSLVQVINLDETDSGAAALSSQDGSVQAGR